MIKANSLLRRQPCPLAGCGTVRALPEIDEATRLRQPIEPFDGFRMAARIDRGRMQLLTRTGLDWTDKYPSAIATLANLNVNTAYIDGEPAASTMSDWRAPSWTGLYVRPGRYVFGAGYCAARIGVTPEAKLLSIFH